MKILVLIVQILSVLPGIIKAVQEMVPSDAGHGTAKKTAVVDALGQIFGNVSEVLPKVLPIIEVLVDVGNRTGGLQKTPAPVSISTEIKTP